MIVKKIKIWANMLGRIQCFLGSFPNNCWMNRSGCLFCSYSCEIWLLSDICLIFLASVYMFIIVVSIITSSSVISIISISSSSFVEPPPPLAWHFCSRLPPSSKMSEAVFEKLIINNYPATGRDLGKATIKLFWFQIVHLYNFCFKHNLSQYCMMRRFRKL